MDVSYNKLFKLLIDKELKKTEFAKQVGISPNTLAKLSRNETVSMDIIVRICRTLNCTVDEMDLPEEQDEITDIQILWPELVMEWTMQFITGEIDPADDAAWQNYVDEMNNQGLETYLGYAQAAYERTVYYQANFA